MPSTPLLAAASPAARGRTVNPSPARISTTRSGAWYVAHRQTYRLSGRPGSSKKPPAGGNPPGRPPPAGDG